MKYCSTITGWGPDALGFLEEEDCNFLILFNEDAPEELAEIAVLHTKAKLAAEEARREVERLRREIGYLKEKK